jgi:drug/metabolite transporter (DMT)-like permease
LKTPCAGLYNFEYPFSVPEAAPTPALTEKPRRWTILAAGLLLAALAVVVIYTPRSAFFSPLALVVVAAIGLVALLLQNRLRRDIVAPVRAPLWLNVLGLLFAIGAVAADLLHLSANIRLIAALGAVVIFAISGIIVIDALRKQRS